ncbi:MAG: hypothetical protein IJH34_10475 [Romboutsia sp.]|nr:hypothetical protein [Romboutsia sp.]
MSKQRKITELVGRVVELKSDNKRYLVMPLELREKALKETLGTIKGRISSSDLIYQNRVVLMPLGEIPEERLKKDESFIEGQDFIVRNIRPEDMEQVKILNDSMSKVLDNIKKLYRNLTELKELEQKQLELEEKIKKLKTNNAEPLGKWDRPANKAYLLELTKNEIETLNAKKRLEDPNRHLYKTSLTGESNATKKEVLELLKVTTKPIYYRYGFSYRGAEAKPVTRDEAIRAWLHGRNGGFVDMDEYEDKVVINEYSSNDMW